MTAPSTDGNSAPAHFDPVPAVAFALSLPAGGVAAVIALLDEGNTVPFIARYRKERTGGLDEVQIRAIEERRTYLVELEERRSAVLASIKEQSKLTPELEQKLLAATTKSELEDLYAPYRPRRKTRASIARERGLQPLADLITAQGAEGDPTAEAAKYLGEHVPAGDDALAGARDIVAEQLADTAEIRAFVRKEMGDHGELVAEVMPGKDNEPTKFEQYYKHREAVKQIPSHRYLAIRRGEAEGVLRAHVAIDSAKVEAGILRQAKEDGGSPWSAQLKTAAADALKRLLLPSVENDVRSELKSRSDVAAVDIFAGNLRNLMLAAPLGGASVIGVDPGLRTGCKCAAIDATGKYLGTITIYISQGEAQLAQAKEAFTAFVKEHQPRAIAVGNGTGGREAEVFCKRTLGDAQIQAPVVSVNEAGASVYSASDLAREEFPELDLTIRGAISIARRLQDPLAELVKIEPKSIGVGQYQHDVQESLLAKRLGDVVESAVNHVGVELNTASAMLLGYVAGIGKSLAKKIVLHRDAHGAFTSRGQLNDVTGLGPKAFEQAAGFLRIRGATNPLDASAVHPERYALVEKMASDSSVGLGELVGNAEIVDKLDLSKYVGGDVGEPTLRDIQAELKKPGRDPRAEFAPPKFRDDVTQMEDLKQGMVLEGVVTNVTAFGAFVDIGVHNDGLVHVSQLAESFVKDPSEVVKVGQRIKVRVLEIDHARKRIALSARPPQQRQQRNDQRGNDRGDQRGNGNNNDQRGFNNDQRNNGGGGGNRNNGPRNNQNNNQNQNRWQGQGHGQGQGPRDQNNQNQNFRGDNNNGPRDQNNQNQNFRGDNNNGPRDQNNQNFRGDNNNQNFRDNNGPRDQNNQNFRGDNNGPRNGGGNYNDRFQGQNNNGPRNGNDGRNDQNNNGPRDQNNNGPRNDGPRNDQNNNGPRNNDRGFRNDRGPRNDGPRNDGPRNDGPRNDGPRNDGPRNDGPRRDDRRNDGPRRDDRGPRNDGPPPQQGQQDQWGVAGFKNSPFAKLKPDDKKKQ